MPDAPRVVCIVSIPDVSPANSTDSFNQNNDIFLEQAFDSAQKANHYAGSNPKLILKMMHLMSTSWNKKLFHMHVGFRWLFR